MEEKIIIRKAEISDFQGVHKLIMQVHKLHVNERNDIYKDVDPMNFDEFKTELSNSNNIYLISEFKNEIVTNFCSPMNLNTNSSKHSNNFTIS